MVRNERLLALRQAAVVRGVGHPTPIFASNSPAGRRSRGLIVRSSIHGSRSRLTLTLRKAPQGCGHPFAASSRMLFKRLAHSRSMRARW
jgi:hypothetical protein